MASESLIIGLIAQKIRNRQCGLFIGAGLSATAGIPSSAILAQELKEVLCTVPDPKLEDIISSRGLTLELISQYIATKVRDQYGAHREVARIIAKAEKIADLSYFEKLAKLPFQYVITTNYDTLIERTFTTFQPDAIVRHDDQASNVFGLGGRPLLVKIHGDITHPEQMVLSKDDLAQYTINHPQLSRLAASLFGAGPMLFLGFAKQTHAFLDLAKSYLASLGPTTHPHEWYVVDRDRLGHELASLSKESTTVIEMEVKQFIDLLTISFKEGRIPPGRAWSIGGAISHLSRTIDAIRTRYQSVAHTINSYQDPGTRYMLAMTLNADLALLITERDKLSFVAHEMREQGLPADQPSQQIEKLLAQAADLYRPIENKVVRDVSSNLFRQFLPGSGAKLDVAQLFDPENFQKESRVVIKCFHPRYGQVPQEVIDQEEDDYAQIVDLRTENRQAEVFALYYMKKYARLQELAHLPNSSVSLKDVQRVFGVRTEDEFYEDCDRAEATVLALDQLEKHIQPLQNAFDSIGLNFAIHGGSADAFINEVKEQINTVKVEVDTLRTELGLGQSSNTHE